MPLFNRFISLPLFIRIEENLRYHLKNVIRESNFYFENPLFITGGANTWGVAEEVSRGFEAERYNFYQVGDNSLQEISNLKEKINTVNPDLLVAVGGGRVIDVAKVVATEKLLPLITFPTTLANDGVVSPVAVIRDGEKLRSIGVNMPVGVLIDLQVIKNSPVKLLKAGIGDLISNITALNDWELACQKGKDKMDGFAYMLSEKAASSILNYSGDNLLAPEFLKLLAEGLVLSGIAMAIAGNSRPASGAEHLISHALDKLFDRPALHGEQVGVAALFTAALQGKNFKELLSFYRKFGLWENPQSIGLNKQQFLEAVYLAPSMRPERYTVLNEDVVQKAAEIYDEVYGNLP
ncbi:iron-containing alcohol dehydrogenase family protein [Carboxydothermus ferrireducens]|uniref:Glycerol-1-phosphate dehydrogenase [NAD(P)+] n=1 Tax=Carboxydothermus ferrireducens DSM 11255 TaxID=1119529 RepID=A0ABX2RAR3_9THEO|nr:iron-containing alcohol dehydrogenase family protein [Carboxydothermus ferrireducens]NYE57682.1 glycerol-1-phosphate dehydrogenase [NAD(P)+] [Carboxydothermus ferrireducens DSM 11255]